MYEIFEKLCKEFDVTPYRVCKETGLSTGTISNWKAGRYTPKNDKLAKIADYFGVSLEYLTTGKQPDDAPVYYLNEETAKIAQEIFENKELRILFDATRDAPPEDVRFVTEMYLALKKKESGSDDTGC